MKITKNTTLKKILEIKNAQKILSKHNVPCVNCPFAEVEMKKLRLEDICKNYGINLDNLLKDLNKLQK